MRSTVPLLVLAACGQPIEPAVDAAPVPDGAVAPDAIPRCGVSGLVDYYPLDSDTADHAGAHDLTATGTTSVPGVLGRALGFDGASAIAQATGAGTLTGARTVCAWVSPTATSGEGQPVFTGGVPNAGDFLAIGAQDPMPTGCATVEGEPYVDHWGQFCAFGMGLAASDATWSMVCYSYDGASSVRLSVGADSYVQPDAFYDWDYPSMTIGASAIGGTTTQAYFGGAIDEVTIWDHALSPTELAKLWNVGAGCAP